MIAQEVIATIALTLPKATIALKATLKVAAEVIVSNYGLCCKSKL